VPEAPHLPGVERVPGVRELGRDRVRESEIHVVPAEEQMVAHGDVEHGSPALRDRVA
jgi:hypothetical protein